MFKIIINASEILQIKNSGIPRMGKEMQNLDILNNHSIIIKDEKIFDIIPSQKTDDFIKNNADIEIIDAENCVVMPGLCDSHTHLVFAGSRENEFEMRVMGKSYMEIMQSGGGIASSVKATRKISEKDLYNISLKRLDDFYNYGTTSVEIKSGYGLDIETELKQLRVAKKLKSINPEIRTTFMGAHSRPAEFETNNDFIEFLNKKVLPEVSKEKLADFCDIFCEKGVFTPDEARKHLLEAKKHGLIPKMHADELEYSAAAEVAGEIGAISADHLMKVSDQGLQKMKKGNTIATLLPATMYNLASTEYPPARKIIDEYNVPVALASDFNPGSCYCENLFLTMHISCQYMKMLPAEVITASTLNGAYAMGLSHLTGSIEKGKLADLIILNAPNYKYIPYHFGINPVRTVVKRGLVLKKR
ncbi:MAG: imidazolonepropionase [Candidatus Muiribacteriota bacterium]